MNGVSMLHECGSGPDGPSHAAPSPAAATDPHHADPVGSAIARLLAANRPDRHAPGPDRTGDASSGTAPYEAAGKALTDGRIAEALVLLADAVAIAEHRSNALLGLAVCAVRLKCFDEGLILALESRNPGPGHPRASHVAGLCELERGNRRAAQAHLATAARLARRNPEFREDLQLAQRTLLLMHLA